MLIPFDCYVSTSAISSALTAPLSTTGSTRGNVIVSQRLLLKKMRKAKYRKYRNFEIFRNCRFVLLFCIARYFPKIMLMFLYDFNDGRCEQRPIPPTCIRMAAHEPRASSSCVVSENIPHRMHSHTGVKSVRNLARQTGVCAATKNWRAKPKVKVGE